MKPDVEHLRQQVEALRERVCSRSSVSTYHDKLVLIHLEHTLDRLENPKLWETLEKATEEVKPYVPRR